MPPDVRTGSAFPQVSTLLLAAMPPFEAQPQRVLGQSVRRGEALAAHQAA